MYIISLFLHLSKGDILKYNIIIFKFYYFFGKRRNYLIKRLYKIKNNLFPIKKIKKELLDN